MFGDLVIPAQVFNLWIPAWLFAGLVLWIVLYFLYAVPAFAKFFGGTGRTTFKGQLAALHKQGLHIVLCAVLGPGLLVWMALERVNVIRRRRRLRREYGASI